MKSRSIKALGVLATGCSVGWLVGLSVSPVVGAVVTALLALVVTLVTAISGLRMDSDLHPAGFARVRRSLKNVSVYFVALLSIAIALGASLGTYARTHDWLGLSLDEEVTAWSRRLGIEKREIYGAIFHTDFSTEAKQEEGQLKRRVFHSILPERGVLHSILQDEPGVCTARDLPPNLLRRRLALTSDQKLQAFAADSQVSDEMVRMVVDKLLCR